MAAGLVATPRLWARAANDARFGAGASARVRRTPRQERASRLRRVLDVAFHVFSVVRLACFVPALLALYISGNADQHSLWTWAGWLGANLTMAAWLFEHNGRRVSPAACASVAAAAMCAAACTMIAAYRWA